jgi:hypothetical protein
MVSVSSTPEGAKVSLDGVEIGKTPMIVPFERDCEGVLRFELAGYQTKTMDVNKVANGWFVANLLWFPVWPVVPVGMIVDLIGHNQGKYSTRPIRAVLTPMPAPVPAPEPTIEIEP